MGGAGPSHKCLFSIFEKKIKSGIVAAYPGAGGCRQGAVFVDLSNVGRNCRAAYAAIFAGKVIPSRLVQPLGRSRSIAPRGVGPIVLPQKHEPMVGSVI